MKKEKMKLLIEKLGWQDVPTSVAEETTQKLINNYISCLSDCCGIAPMSSDLAADMLLSDDMNSDAVYSYLFINDYHSLNDTENNRKAISLRWEIENELRHGNSLEDARLEWDI